MPSQQSTLLFQVATPGLARRGVRSFAKRLEAEVTGGRGFCCLIAGDEELRRLNREFRGLDYPTDVLSFPVRSQVGDLRHLGEIAISFETARRLAAEYGHGVDQEIEILMLHGLLHLLGMDHETDGGRMLSVEQKWRARLGLPAGLIERVGA
jgi:probable rRNA maturation factor